MKYTIYHRKNAQRFITIKWEVDFKAESMDVLLPRWRPGRYEFADFVQYVRDLQFTDETGETLSFEKKNISSWKVRKGKGDKLIAIYNYYVKSYDAGSSWITDEMLYVNPVNCLLYTEESLIKSQYLSVDIDSAFELAINATKEGDDMYSFPDFHALVDTPFIASLNLQKHTFNVEGIDFRLFFEGGKNLDFLKIEKDIVGYTKVQLDMMRSFPVKNYDYYILVPPYEKYHGVEHQNSTVVMLGPDHNIMNPSRYSELMGVCSHELFHTWNVKYIRPEEMYPYDYQNENFNKLGYVTEGVTTYYGDLFLKRSGFFSVHDYFVELSKIFDKHFENEGRHRKSVADASFDTWIDGYKPGIPHTKTNIYTEGCLTALMTDLAIRLNSADEKSLDDVMRYLYTSFGEQKKGYSEEEYQLAVNEFGKEATETIFKDHIYGTKDFEPTLKMLLDKFGIELYLENHPNNLTSNFGLIMDKDVSSLVARLVGDSIGERAGIEPEDQILAINGTLVSKSNFQSLSIGKELEVTIKRFGKIISIPLITENKQYLPKRRLRLKKQLDSTEKKYLINWLKLI